MTIQIGSFAYVFYILVDVAAAIALTLILKNRKDRTKKIVIFLLLAVNFLQHIFKLQIYPYYRAFEGHKLLKCTADNVCALLTIASPFVFLSKSKTLKDGAFAIGILAGLSALLVPDSNIVGRSMNDPETIRFMCTHIVILSTSVLPVTTGLHKLDYRRLWKIPFVYLLMQIVIIVNDTVVICSGNYYVPVQDGYYAYTVEELYQGLVELNPGWAFEPFASLGILNNFLVALAPKIFTVNAEGEPFYWPFVWCAPATYVAFFGYSVLLCLVFDFVHIKNDVVRAAKFLFALLKRFFSFSKKLALAVAGKVRKFALKRIGKIEGKASEENAVLQEKEPEEEPVEARPIETAQAKTTEEAEGQAETATFREEEREEAAPSESGEKET